MKFRIIILTFAIAVTGLANTSFASPIQANSYLVTAFSGRFGDLLSLKTAYNQHHNTLYKNCVAKTLAEDFRGFVMCVNIQIDKIEPDNRYYTVNELNTKYNAELVATTSTITDDTEDYSISHSASTTKMVITRYFSCPEDMNLIQVSSTAYCYSP